MMADIHEAISDYKPMHLVSDQHQPINFGHLHLEEESSTPAQPEFLACKTLSYNNCYIQSLDAEAVSYIAIGK